MHAYVQQALRLGRLVWRARAGNHRRQRHVVCTAHCLQNGDVLDHCGRRLAMHVADPLWRHPRACDRADAALSLPARATDGRSRHREPPGCRRAQASPLRIGAVDTIRSCRQGHARHDQTAPQGAKAGSDASHSGFQYASLFTLRTMAPACCQYGQHLPALLPPNACLQPTMRNAYV